MSCPMCQKRPPKRFCPAKGEKICPVCCGREREITIDCLADCSHLLAAHRYESEHRTPVSAAEFPYRDIQVPPEFVYGHWAVIAGLATTILTFQLQNNGLHDGDASAALEALAETFRTLGTGLYYERPPDAPLARALYGQLAQFLQEFRKDESARAATSPLKDSDAFHLLIFLLRLAKQETNGRLRSRAFLAFLRTSFPRPAEAPKEGSRIILP